MGTKKGQLFDEYTEMAVGLTNLNVLKFSRNFGKARLFGGEITRM